MRFRGPHIYRFLRFIALCAVLSGMGVYGYSQSAGDYRSRANGNWNQSNTWQTYNGSTWVNTANYPGRFPGSGVVTVRHTVTLNVNLNNAIGSLVVEANTLRIDNADRTLNITDDLIISGGTLSMSENANRELTLYVGGDFTISGGTLTENNNYGTIYFVGSGTQVYSKTGGTISNDIRFVVNSGSNFDMGTSVLDGSIGTFTLNDGATLTTAHTEGISSTGATGSVQVTGTRSFGSDADYVYNGTAAQITGDGLPSAVNNLTIDNSSGVSLTSSVQVNGTLVLTDGAFTVGANTLTLNGPAISGTSTNLTTSSSSSLTFSGTSTGIFIPSSVADLNNLTVNNANGVTVNSDITLASGGILTLTDGILDGGSYTLSVTNTSASAIISSTSAFVNLSGGALQRSLPAGLSVSANDYLFPVGDGNEYKALNLTDITTGAAGPVISVSVSTTGAETGDGTTIDPVDPRYWSLINTNSGDFTSAAVELYESGLDDSKTIGLSTAIAGTYSSVGGTLNASSIISPVLTDPGPYFCIGSIYRDTYYSYQTGDWNVVSTWTKDPSGTLQTSTTIPGNNDRVIILTDRTVYLPSDVTDSNIEININAGGILDLQAYRFTNTQSSLKGEGTLRLASANFPVTVTNTFVASGGGTTEYYNSSDFTFASYQDTYNNLIINCAGFTATQLSNITLNGNLYVKSGTYRINDNSATTKLTLSVAGSVTVDNGASVTVGNGPTNTTIGGTGGTAPYLNYYGNFHTVIINGDFTNNGTVRFTNLDYPLYTSFPPTSASVTSGAASVYFEGSADNTLTCNGITDFYNLIVNKGTDQTYKLTVSSSDYTFFRLYGANSLAAESVSGSPALRKALWIYAGTLELKGKAAIPSLSEGTAANAHYYIPSNGALLVNGVDVVVLSTADDYREVNLLYNVSSPGNASSGITSGGNSALYVFGKLQIDNGYLSTRESGGIITSSTASGQVIINGGTVDAKQFLSSTGTASYAQTGGLFVLRGRFQRVPVAYSSVSNLTDVSVTTLGTTRATNGISSGYGTFNLENTDNVYSVSGGTIRIYDSPGTGVSEVFDVKSSAANISVTGGTLELIPTTGSIASEDATDHTIYSNAPVYNLTINRASSNTTVRMTTDLAVLNDLYLLSGSLNANSNDLSIGGDFTLESGTTYTTGTNTTTLNGTDNQEMIVNLASALSLSSFTIDKVAGDTVTLSGTQNTINISASFSLYEAALDDGGMTINVTGNLYNSGLHFGDGVVVLNGSDPQTIDGGGTFNNIELNNTDGIDAPVSLLANLTITGDLTFSQDKLFDISTFNLYLDAAATIVNAGTNRFIQTAGTAGDGGLTRMYADITDFVFPIGVDGKYTPATIGFTSAPDVFGSVTVVPVDYEHPVTTINGQSLTYFWRVRSSGFSGIPLYSVSHTFVYDNADVPSNDNGYVPALYDGAVYTWYYGQEADVDKATNTISDWSTPTNSTNFLDADYTAGLYTSFGTPTIFYSRQSGLWSTTSSWSLSGHNIDDVPTSAPGANDIVVIGDNDSIYLSTETPPFPTNNNNPNNQYYRYDEAVVNCASLQIEAGAVLDIQNNPGCTFASVFTHPNGNGKIRLTTRDMGNFDNPEFFIYPNGDFSEFSANDGISEFYTINPQAGTYYILPSNADTYGTVILTPLGGSNVILPNISTVTIYGDLICNGSETGAWLAMSWLGEYGAVNAKSVTVEGDLKVYGGSFGFIYNNNTLQQITINGDVYVAPDAAIDVWTNTTNNKMLIGGNIYNNSNYGTNNESLIRFLDGTNRCDVTFFGNNSSYLTNDAAVSTTPYTVFGNVTVNKGSTKDSTITWNIGGTLSTPTNGWLTLENGTLVYDRTGDFTISTTTDFTIPSTAGLTLNTPSDVFISNSASSETLYLNGRMTILTGGGNVYIGPQGNTANNADIEYSGSGASVIEIQSGSLFVNGQIRRPVASTNGVLSYYQSGGSVIVYGNNAVAAKAKLEVLNSGSLFNMSAGTLTIVRGGGTTYGDLYLRPSSSSVSGGTIIFSQAPDGGTLIDSEQSYTMDASVSLYDLTITGKTAATARNATLTLMVSPLVLSHTLTLSNANSFFTSNNLNVSIAGNMVNNGTYSYGTNTTIFNGNIQSITGSSVTDFYNLTVSSVSSLTVSNNFTIYKNLALNTGTLVLSTYAATVAGNVVNNASYTDDNITGGITLGGTSQQQVEGTGSFARLVLNNSSGARLNSDITLQHDLVLSAGVLDINTYQLTLTQNSLVGGTSFSSAKMIKSDGVTSSMGVMKYFTTGDHTFTFPVGVSGKYTPAVLTITSSTAVGSVRINPVNGYHPSVLDPLNALQYYWQIESAGIAASDVNTQLHYVVSDVSGTESDYVAAWLELPGNEWDKATPGAATDNVDETNHIITFDQSGTINLNGDFTAGSDTAIPDEIATYQTISDGDWSDETIWSPVGGSPACPVGGPDGCYVIIENIVTVDINYISAISTTLNGELRIPAATYGHSLGEVTGTGKLYLEKGNLPAGTYTSFIDCSGNGTIEYGGTGTYTIVASLYSSIPNLIFSGSGTRVLPNKDLTICKSLIIDGPTLDNSVNNRMLTIMGTMERYDGGLFTSGSGTYPLATVVFAGSYAQTVGGATGDFTGTSKFHNLEINNASGLTINSNGAIEVNNSLLLTNGIITTTTTNTLTLLSTSESAVTPSGGSSSSFVNGPLTKYIINGDDFLYPVGQGTTKGHDFTVTSAAGTTMAFTAEYYTPNATSASLTYPLEAVNTLEYWSVWSTASTFALVKIGWDSQSDLTPLITTNGISDMRVAEYSASSWIELSSSTTGDDYTGDVATTGNVTILTTGTDFTTAAVSGTLARAAMTPDGAVCGEEGIPVSFTSYDPISLNYTIDYTINGNPQATITVTSLPYTLPTTSVGEYQLTAFTYNNGAGTGVVDLTTVYVYAEPQDALAGGDQSLCGVSSTILDANDPLPYAGMWTIVSGSGGSFDNNALYNTGFNGILGNTYTLRWTITNGSCSSYDDVTVSFPVTAVAPADFTAAATPVCPGSVGNVYTVPYVAGITYTWSYSGTGYTINGSGNSITIDFDAAATAGTLSVTATNDCGTSAARTVNIEMYSADFSYDESPFCQNESDPLPTIGGSSQAGVFSSDPGLVFISTATGQINLESSISGTYTVTNTVDISGCGTITSTSSVTVSSLTWTGTTSTDWNEATNWSCGFVPYQTTSILIPDVTNKPVVSTGTEAMVYDLSIDTGSSLTVTGNTIKISGVVTSNGTFTAENGAVEMNGSAAQTIGSGLFNGNSVNGLTVNNSSGVTLQGELIVTGIVSVTAGNLASDGNLTLASTASGTALIDGAGSGEVTGNVTMQRYLDSGFGYKYLASPFQAATVNELSDEINLSSSFPLLYKYDESRTASGWMSYVTTTNILYPLSGYAANMGSSAAATTIDMTGVVNNGDISVTLYNNNNTYTKGFNLVGNPYPSPVDWDIAAGWTRTNIDDAIYYFRASVSDQYGGTYSTYAGGISSDGMASNIIPSMQGFFVHVSDGSYPVSGTFGVTNSARITNLTQPFLKSAQTTDRFLLRLTATFTDDTSSTDPMVVYFDAGANDGFDSNLDALKLFNTDLRVPNLYSLLADGRKLSINALPEISGNTLTVPLGIKVNRAGEISFRIRDLENIPEGTSIFIVDATAGIQQDLLSVNEYKVTLATGEYTDRFSLGILKNETGITEIADGDDYFSVYASHGMVRATVFMLPGGPGTIEIYDLAGRLRDVVKVPEAGYYEFDPGLITGIYIVRFVSGTTTNTKKILITE